ncbi:MAG: DUF433 domain-containing protein [Hormoscilla sp. GUM202]|nr:DUF433 domain-containing protein [Hormoscilla sp. GUM202]
MNRSQTEHKYVELDENHVPTIAGTTMKVVELVTEQFTNGWSPEELHFQYGHLSMSQIHAALAYYWDNQEEMDGEIERGFTDDERRRLEAGPSPLVAKLRSQGMLTPRV